MNKNSLRSSWNKAAISSQKINDKQNFGFNSFIGSGNTPQDLKMQQRKKARNGFASGKQSLVVSEKPIEIREKHILNSSSSGNPMRDRLMTEFLKNKIGHERYEKVELLL